MSTSATTPGSCPRTGHRRLAPLAPGATRPSDALTAFLAAGAAWITAGLAAGIAFAITDDVDVRRLAVHCLFVGGVSQIVVGTAQFFAGAFLATGPPGRRIVRTELAIWNGAALAAALGIALDVPALVGAGGTLALAGLAVYVRELLAMRRRSLQRMPWATRWYLTAAAFLACGAVLGPLMAADAVWTHGSLLGAHLAVNIGGWFGTTIVGTLHTFHPSLTETDLRHPRLQRPTWLTWTAGISLLAIGAAFDLQAVAVIAWALLLLAVGLLGANLLSSAVRGQVRTAGAILVTAAQAMLAVGIVLGLVSAAEHGPLDALLGPDREDLAAAIVAGWLGLTVTGSLVHLLGLMERVRLLPARRERPAADAAALAGGSCLATGVLALALADPSGVLHDAVRALLGAGLLALVARILVLARRAVRAAPLEV